MALKVLGFAGFQRGVRDVARSVDFYCQALGFEEEEAGRLRLGSETVDLFSVPDGSFDDGLRYAQGVVDGYFQHIAIVASDMAAAFERLQAYSPRPISQGGPVRLPAGAGGVTAYKFLDPDGRPLELIQFPAGAGDPRWQQAGAGPTLGIDHSAIVVSDVEESIAFYRDELGFELASRQVNEGPTQDRLDGIVAVRVDVGRFAAAPVADPAPGIVGLRAAEGSRTAAHRPAGLVDSRWRRCSGAGTRRSGWPRAFALADRPGRARHRLIGVGRASRSGKVDPLDRPDRQRACVTPVIRPRCRGSGASSGMRLSRPGCDPPAPGSRSTRWARPWSP